MMEEGSGDDGKEEAEMMEEEAEDDGVSTI